MANSIKIGALSIRKDAGTLFTLDEFKKHYSKALGEKVETVYYQLGGEKPKPKRSTVKDTKDKG